MTTAQILVIAAALLVLATPASAKSCEDLAAACTKQSGHAACFEAGRMKRCKSTSVYTAPDGKSAPADKKK